MQIALRPIASTGRALERSTRALAAAHEPAPVVALGFCRVGVQQSANSPPVRLDEAHAIERVKVRPWLLLVELAARTRRSAHSVALVIRCINAPARHQGGCFADAPL